jgi:ribokinase
MSVAIVTEGGAYGAVIVSGANAAIDGSELVIPPAARLLLLQNEVPEPANLAAARTARDRGLKVILNAAPARPASPDLLSLTDILVVNRVEAADLTGVTPEALDPDTAAVRILTGGPRAVILTLGEAGAVLAEAGRAPRHLPAFPVRALSSHGAGDAFLGALASELAAGACLDHALTFGQAAAARHVSTPTADRATVTRASVSALAATAT